MRSRAPRRLLSLALLLTFGPATTGCSFVFVRRPPDRRDRRRAFDFSSSYAFPALDTGLAIGGLGLMAVNGSTPWLGYKALGVGFAAAFIFAVSAAHGYRAVSECQEALEAPAETPHPRPAPAVRTYARYSLGRATDARATRLF